VAISSLDAPTHPFITCSSDGLLKVQLYIEKANHLHVTNSSDWPGELICPSACAGLSEVAATNLVVWISPAQVDCLVFVPHLDECKHQIWGPMCGRAHCHFIQSTLLFGENTDQYFFANLPANQYSISHGFPQEKPPSTFTERILESLYVITRQNTKLLTRTAKMPSKVDSKFFLPRESFEYISNQLSTLSEAVLLSSCKTQTKQCINHPNLSLESARVPTTKSFIVADTQEGIDAARRVFSSLLGIGVRKRHPPLSAIGDIGLNPVTLQIDDTINMCGDILRNNVDDMENWFDNDAVDVRKYNSSYNNMIRWVYDFRLRECTMSMRCLALKFGACQAQALIDYLEHNAVPYRIALVQSGTNLNWRNDLWVVRSVDTSNNQAVIYNRFDNETAVISIDEAEQSIMN